VPSDTYPITGEVSVIGDYVIMISLTGGRPIGTTVRNSEVAKAMKTIFDMAWETAAPYN
jgi:hypothetical protein